MRQVLDIKKTAKKIQNVRKSLGFSINDIAKELGVSYQCVYQWENGQKIPTIQNMVALSGVLDKNIGELIVITGE